MDIKLRFVNKSNDGNKSEVLIYQKNVLTTMASLSVAWKVIRYCGRDCTHPFIYPDGYEVSVTDENANFTPRLKAKNGQITIQGGQFSGSGYTPPVALQSAAETIDMTLVAVGAPYNWGLWCNIHVPGFDFEGNAFEFSTQYNNPPPYTVWE